MSDTAEPDPESSSITGAFPLWSDDPASLDLLSFSAIAETVVDAVLDDALDPVALGLSGPWGSGKTTVLRLIQRDLDETNTAESKILLVATDPWRYDPAVGAKETLIGEVLGCLQTELEQVESASPGKAAAALGILRKLAGRVDWAKAIRMAATTSLTLQLPKVDDVLQLVRPSGDEGEQNGPRGLEEFRDDFDELMSSTDLAHVRRVVVLVDDLDRCLPETVIDTLETIRLFLAVPKMSFVIAADEQRVADAIRTRFTPGAAAGRGQGEHAEEPAQLYLHKIVQTTVPLLALSRFDTEAYLVLLQLAARLPESDLIPYVSRCTELRRESAGIDGLAEGAAHDIGPEMLFAARLTPILYEKLRGNPRRIKRFLNDLHVRQAIAARRGITLEPEVVAKLMVLEVLLPEGFKKVLDWLARSELREQMTALERAAGRAPIEVDTPATGDPVGTDDASEAVADERTADGDGDPEFGDELLRWAKLPPALGIVDLGPYLYLAAAFAGEPLLDADLPERLRDLAANLLSSVRAEQKSVTEDDLRALSPNDAEALVRHLGRAARDRPSEQRAAVLGILRITRLHGTAVETATKLFIAIPADEVQVASILSFADPDVAVFRSALDTWEGAATADTVKRALDTVLKKGGV